MHSGEVINVTNMPAMTLRQGDLGAKAW